MGVSTHGEDMPEDDAQEMVSRVDLGYWAPGKAFCMQSGPRYASQEEESRAASLANIVESMEGDPGLVKAVAAGAEFTLERVEG